MSEDEYEEMYFPGCHIERIGVTILIQCQSEDDAIVAFEIFRDVSLGKSVSFRKAPEA